MQFNQLGKSKENLPFLALFKPKKKVNYNKPTIDKNTKIIDILKNKSNFNSLLNNKSFTNNQGKDSQNKTNYSIGYSFKNSLSFHNHQTSTENPVTFENWQKFNKMITTRGVSNKRQVSKLRLKRNKDTHIKVINPNLFNQSTRGTKNIQLHLSDESIKKIIDNSNKLQSYKTSHTRNNTYGNNEMSCKRSTNQRNISIEADYFSSPDNKNNKENIIYNMNMSKGNSQNKEDSIRTKDKNVVNIVNSANDKNVEINFNKYEIILNNKKRSDTKEKIETVDDVQKQFNERKQTSENKHHLEDKNCMDSNEYMSNNSNSLQSQQQPFFNLSKYYSSVSGSYANDNFGFNNNYLLSKVSQFKEKQDTEGENMDVIMEKEDSKDKYILSNTKKRPTLTFVPRMSKIRDVGKFEIQSNVVDVNIVHQSNDNFEKISITKNNYKDIDTNFNPKNNNFNTNIRICSQEQITNLAPQSNHLVTFGGNREREQDYVQFNLESNNSNNMNNNYLLNLNDTNISNVNNNVLHNSMKQSHHRYLTMKTRNSEPLDKQKISTCTLNHDILKENDEENNKDYTHKLPITKKSCWSVPRKTPTKTTSFKKKYRMNNQFPPKLLKKSSKFFGDSGNFANYEDKENEWNTKSVKFFYDINDNEDKKELILHLSSFSNNSSDISVISNGNILMNNAPSIKSEIENNSTTQNEDLSWNQVTNESKKILNSLKLRFTSSLTNTKKEKEANRMSSILKTQTQVLKQSYPYAFRKSAWKRNLNGKRFFRQLTRIPEDNGANLDYFINSHPVRNILSCGNLEYDIGAVWNSSSEIKVKRKYSSLKVENAEKIISDILTENALKREKMKKPTIKEELNSSYEQDDEDNGSSESEDDNLFSDGKSKKSTGNFFENRQRSYTVNLNQIDFDKKQSKVISQHTEYENKLSEYLKVNIEYKLSVIDVSLTEIKENTLNQINWWMDIKKEKREDERKLTLVSYKENVLNKIFYDSDIYDDYFKYTVLESTKTTDDNVDRWINEENIVLGVDTMTNEMEDSNVRVKLNWKKNSIRKQK